MDILKRKYEDLIAKETDVKKNLSRSRGQQKRPREQVFLWLEQVETIKYQFESLKRYCKHDTANHLVSSYLHRKHFKLIRNTTKLVDHLQETSRFPEGLIVSDELYVEQFPDRPQLLVKPQLVGHSIQKTLDDIFESLMDLEVGIIGIYGVGGVGKTTAMLNINHRLSTTQIFDKVIWVTLSKNPSLEKVQNDIAMQLNVFLPTYENEASRATRLLECLEEIKKFLIILDNLWEPISLNTVGIPLPKGSKIVVISRYWQVCQRMETNKYIKINVLSEQEAWDLFLSKAGDVSPHIQPLARQLVYKCDYLPILLISLGYAMRGEADINEWMEALKKLYSTLSAVQGTEGKNIRLLKFIYARLKTDQVRDCFSYCAFFPEDYLFEPEELIRYWIAEGYIGEKPYMALGMGCDMVTLIEEGVEILKELQDANMLEMFTRKGREWLKMHDLFRDLAINIMRADRNYLRAGEGLKMLPSINEWGFSRKISFMRNHIEILDDIRAWCPFLSTLSLCDNPLTHVSPLFFNTIAAVQVLDMSYSGISEMPLSLSTLVNLRVLFLQNCTSLRKIPSVENLKKLQILNLRRTSIKELPQGIEGLLKLRSLDLSETMRLKTIAVGMISSLVNLEELHLKRSWLCTMDSPIVAIYLREIRCLRRLQILTLSVIGFGEHLEIIVSLQMRNLKRFSVNMYGSTGDFV